MPLGMRVFSFGPTGFEPAISCPPAPCSDCAPMFADAHSRVLYFAPRGFASILFFPIVRLCARSAVSWRTIWLHKDSWAPPPPLAIIKLGLHGPYHQFG